MTGRTAIRDLIPPVLTRALRPRQYGFFGDYPTWNEAVAAATPYRNDFTVLDQLAARIKRGEALGPNALAILAGLRLCPSPARVIDFGGSLGFGYFHVAPLAQIKSWHVVELPDVAAYGTTHYADQTLSFGSDIPSGGADMVLCGGTLQYLEEPYAILQQLAKLNAAVIVIDRVPLGRERVMIQKVAPDLGGSVHPIRVLSDENIDAALNGYRSVARHFNATLAPECPDVSYGAQVWRHG